MVRIYCTSCKQPTAVYSESISEDVVLCRACAYAVVQDYEHVKALLAETESLNTDLYRQLSKIKNCKS
jgi:hypothetical protein